MAKTVSVIIPAYNQIGLLLHAIECIRGRSRVGEVIIIDDGSEPDQAQAMDNIGGCKVLHNKGSDGFVHSVRWGVKKSEHPYILLLNSDAFAVGDPVAAMAANLDAGYAICGARLLFARGSKYGVEGTIQHAGIGFNKFGIPFHPYMSYPGDEPCALVWRSVNAVTGAAMMVKREVWDRLGGFDTKFGRGVYDDCDLCLSAKKLKYEIAYEPKAMWHHLMHGSQTDTNNFFNQKDHDHNLSLLFTKHGQPACDDHIFFNMKGG